MYLYYNRVKIGVNNLYIVVYWTILSKNSKILLLKTSSTGFICKNHIKIIGISGFCAILEYIELLRLCKGSLDFVCHLTVFDIDF